MDFIETPIPDLFLVQSIPIADGRGMFARTFCKKEFAKINFNQEFVQFNHSFNLKKGTIRGMHFQNPPFTETKLIRCIQGKVFDVAIDIRKNSSTFLQHFAVELSAENMLSILIPKGFAHGFQTLEDNSTLIYHHTDYYTQQADAGVRYDDPATKINWQLPAVNVSDKDKNYPLIDINFKGI